MPILLRWQDDKKVTLYCEVEGEWSLDDAWNNLNGTILDYINSVSYVPDIIINFTPTNYTPSGLLSFWRRAYQWMQEHGVVTSIVIFVDVPPAMRGIGDTLRNLRVPIMRYMFFVESVEEGQTLIDNLRKDSPRQRLNND
ncbi:MAG: hypothetical protein Phog2KO_10110 [Phototrophicaceae bacterium]